MQQLQFTMSPWSFVMIWALMLLGSDVMRSSAQMDSIHQATWGRPDDVWIVYGHLPQDTTLAHGRFDAFYQGQNWIQGQFQNGLKEGFWQTFHLETQNSTSSGHFLHGQPHGTWTFNYPDGRLKAKGQFHLGRPTGEWKSFHAGVFLEPRLQAKWSEEALEIFNPNGDTLLTRRQSALGLIERIHAKNGKLLREAQMRWQSLDSERMPLHNWPETWHPDSVKRTRLLLPTPIHHVFSKIDDEALKNGGFWIPWGSVRRYSHYGALMEHAVWHGDTLLQWVGQTDPFGKPIDAEKEQSIWHPSQGNGLIKRHFSDGHLAAIIPYRHNLMHGKVQWFMPNGRLLGEGQYDGGSPNGKWSFYEVTGRLAMTADATEEDGVVCWTGTEWTLTGKKQWTFQTWDGWLHGPQTTFDAFGDTVQLSLWNQGRLHGEFRTYQRGIPFLVGRHQNHVRQGVWQTLNARGKITHVSEYQKPPKQWAEDAWLPPKTALGPTLPLGSGGDEAPSSSPLPWTYRNGVAPSAGFDWTVGLTDQPHLPAWRWVDNDISGAAAWLLNWDISGHNIQLIHLFSESHHCSMLGQSSLQRFLVMRPEERFGFPLPGSAVFTLQQDN